MKLNKLMLVVFAQNKCSVLLPKKADATKK